MPYGQPPGYLPAPKQYIDFETSKERTAIADLIGSQFLLPFDSGGPGPGLGYYTFGKFGSEGLHLAKKTMILNKEKDTYCAVLEGIFCNIVKGRTYSVG